LPPPCPERPAGNKVKKQFAQAEESPKKMKTVYSAANISLVSIFKDVLTGHGIRCWIKNEFTLAGMGEIPPIECWPQLLVDDDDFTAASRIVQEALAEKETASWQCPECAEEIAGQFTECWNCGTSRPPAPRQQAKMPGSRHD
jgi:hypothetical protein